MSKIECVLLVDDSISTNVYNTKLIEKTGIVNIVNKVINGIEALNYLNQGKSYKNAKRPNIIFLDINMPKMDGFEFLEHYSKLPSRKKADMIIVFLTTSNWTKDKVKALDKDIVFDFLEKPLKKEDLKRVCDYYIKNVLITS